MTLSTSTTFGSVNATRAAAVSESSPRSAGPGVLADRGERKPVHLTPRQLQVLALLCEGLPNKLICRRLNISAGTTKVHINSIYRALGVCGRVQAVVRARQYGIITDDTLWQPESPTPSRERVGPDVTCPAPRVSRFELARFV